MELSAGTRKTGRWMALFLLVCGAMHAIQSDLPLLQLRVRSLARTNDDPHSDTHAAVNIALADTQVYDERSASAGSLGESKVDAEQASNGVALEPAAVETGANEAGVDDKQEAKEDIVTVVDDNASDARPSPVETVDTALFVPTESDNTQEVIPVPDESTSGTIPTQIKQTENSSTSNSETPVSTPDYSCEWKPDDDEPCVNGLSQRLQMSLPGAPLGARRWIVLGDSTFSQLWKFSALQHHLTKAAPVLEACAQQYQCTTVRAGRCDTNEQLKIPRPDHWLPPNSTLAEGPVHHGLENHFCQDCYGCDTVVLSCDNRESNQPCRPTPTNSTSPGSGSYGGYISVEFARDTEIQSHDFTTTQENIVHYIDRDWNTDAMVADFGRPICVVGAGFHDMSIRDVKLDGYLTNVQWYVSLLLTVCDHVVWLANTCPQTDDYVQKKGKVKAWNLAVRDLLREHDSQRTSFIDVFDASVEYDHKDNIHMDKTWYDLLGSMFLKVIRGHGDSTLETASNQKRRGL